MKKLLSLLFSVVLIFSLNSAYAQVEGQTEENAEISEKSKVEVYYFHGTRRCETCKAVGKVSKDLVDKKYGSNENVSFIEIDYDEEGHEALVEKFEVTSSGLYVYNQKEVVNLTTYAFQYAVTNPQKLESKLKNTINKNLK